MILVISLWAQLACRDPLAGVACRASMESRGRTGSKAGVGCRATPAWREIQARRVGEGTLARRALMEFRAVTGPRAMLVSRGYLETGGLTGPRASRDCPEPLGSLGVRAREDGKATRDTSDPPGWLDPQDPGVHQEVTACQESRVPPASPNRKDLQEPGVVRGQPGPPVSSECRECRAGREPGGRTARSSWELGAAKVSQERLG